MRQTNIYDYIKHKKSPSDYGPERPVGKDSGRSEDELGQRADPIYYKKITRVAWDPADGDDRTEQTVFEFPDQ